MSKILPILTVGILVLSGLGAAAITTVSTYDNSTYDDKIVGKSDMITLTFSPFAIEEYNSEYIEVNLEEPSKYYMNPGHPVVPKIVKTFELPFTAYNIKIDVTINNVKEYEIEKEIRPASPHIPLIATEEPLVVKAEKNEKVYASEDPFPSTWYSYRVSCGLNDKNERVTHVAIPLYPVRYAPALNKIFVAESAEIEITYDFDDVYPFPTGEEYDMVIIAPRKFALALYKLVRHKNNVGVKTFLKTTESIYRQYYGVDKPEEIKLFIKDAIEEHDIKYVLLVGGLRNQIWGNPREHRNYGARWWYVPVRYHNFYDDPEHPLSFAKIHDPGVITDLYYADVFKEGGVFDDWDSNNDSIIGAWNFLPDPENVSNDTIDMDPDVALGRLACRNILEVRIVVNKIVNYEKTAADSSWFKKMISISGDGFMDQEDLDFQWDTNGLPDGEYTIYAASQVNENEPFGTPDEIHITIDKTQPTNITFNHDDYLRINKYPAYPIAEIVSISDGDVIGNTNYFYEPHEGQAYGNNFSQWANVEYTDGILHIRGKTYDPSPYGNITNMHVWILNEEGEKVFDDWRNGSEMYYEGEWVTGEKVLKGGGGAMFYMPDDFQKEIIWASNGKLTGPDDIISSLSEGCGFAFLSGHGSPNVWTDHFPGIPGNRRKGSIPAISVFNFKEKFPFVKFQMNRITNWDKLPVVLIGGCHNSQFNVSMIAGFLDKINPSKTKMWCYGMPVPECFSWYLVKLPRRGAIATIGNTGLGYGVLGKDCLVEGLDGGICIEFFKQYGMEYNVNKTAILGDVYRSTLHSYWETFDMDFLDHAKSLTQWVLMGDPSLKLGGY
jgi:hypothetical protein